MTVAEILAQHPFTRSLDEAGHTALAGMARLATYATGEVVFREGASAEGLFLLARGRVALEQHVHGRGAVQLENIEAGDLLGLSWAFPGQSWLLTARVVEDCEMVVLGARPLLALMESQPALGYPLAMALARQIYGRLERTRLQRLDVYRAEK